MNVMNMARMIIPGQGRNEAALLALMERTGYNIIQENGQRKYGPPPGWDPSVPVPRGCEVFVGKIPRDCYEDELVPVFEKIGPIYELRLMMDFSGANRGYCFVTYSNREDAKRAVKELNNFQIRKGRYLGVCLSVDNCRLFVGGIPKTKTKEEIMVEMKKVTEGVVDVIVYPSATDKSKNRGFAFVEYESHRAAAMARRKLIPGRIQLWGHTIAVDWAEPEQEVDEDVMSKVKILYVRNLMMGTTEGSIERAFNRAVNKDGAVERVKKLRDYAFVHFRDRDDALRAIRMLNGSMIEGSIVEVSLAKPVHKHEHVRHTRGIGKKFLRSPQVQMVPASALQAQFFMQQRQHCLITTGPGTVATPSALESQGQLPNQLVTRPPPLFYGQPPITSRMGVVGCTTGSATVPEVHGSVTANQGAGGWIRWGCGLTPDGLGVTPGLTQNHHRGSCTLMEKGLGMIPHTPHGAGDYVL